MWTGPSSPYFDESLNQWTYLSLGVNNNLVVEETMNYTTNKTPSKLVLSAKFSLEKQKLWHC